ncbi:MAG: alanine racemase [bacterium]|nr:alanine racemase [bacterium]
MKVNTMGLRTWIEVDRKAIKHNYHLFRTLIPKKTKLMAVVKSNAYGHSLLDFAKETEKLGVDFIGVDSMVEALALRREGIKAPILVLGYTLPEWLSEAAQQNISVTVSQFETLEAIKKTKFPSPLKIHIKVDTGMHRQGFLLSQQKPLVSIVKGQLSNVQIEGLYTHFASAKNPAFPHDTQAQIRNFKVWIDAFKKAGFKPIVHAAATAGALLFPESHFDMVRVGIGLYGLWPAKEVKAFLSDKIKLKSAMTWKTIISEIKTVPKGARVGYDLTEQLDRVSTIAVCPVGYWHGYPRSLSSIGRVMVGGKECKVLGRVSMDMLTIDVSGVKKSQVGDEVIILGPDGDSPVSAEGISRLTDDSWYEVVTCLNPLIKRIYT